VVDVERRHAVAIFGGVVEQLTHADQCHDVSPDWCGSEVFALLLFRNLKFFCRSLPCKRPAWNQARPAGGVACGASSYMWCVSLLRDHAARLLQAVPCLR